MPLQPERGGLPGAPYPGLRPFEADEAHLFFGREQQVDALLARLHRSRFVAVVGESGAGKSSLVRAGLLPALEAGFLAAAGSDWRIVLMRPGSAPMDAMADELLRPGVLSPEGGVPAREFAAAELRRGPLGLVQLVGDAGLPEHANLLLVVDQFEELFRFSALQRRDEAGAFVDLLLHAVGQREVRIYVVLTMRSDFIGACARFRGLPEALNDNQFLTPRLTREQVGMAIRCPAQVFGGQVEDVLVAELENEVGDDPDQLPLLQHLLLRMWQHASAGQAPPSLTLPSYRELGGFRQALDQHAEQIYLALSDAQKPLAERLFKSLTGSREGRRDLRRPVRLGEVAAAAAVGAEAVAAVVEIFRAPGRHFLMPPLAIALGPDTQLDISHESLIRQWLRLRQWVEDESANARDFLGLRDEALRWKRAEGELVAGRDLLRALDWRDRSRPTAAWAERYATPEEYASTLEFIEASAVEDRRQRHERRAALVREAAAARKLRWLSRVLSVLLVVSAALGGLALKAKIDAQSARIVAERARAEAEDGKQRLEAEQALSQASEMVFRNPQRALQNLLVAVRRDSDNPQAVMALRRALGSYVPSIRYQGVQRLNNISASGEFWLGFTLGPENFSPADDRVVIPTERGADIHDIADGKRIELGRGGNGHTDIVGSAGFSPDGRRVVTTSGDRTARLWDATSGALLHVLEHGAAVNSAVFDATGRSLVTASDPSVHSGKGEITLWDVATGARLPRRPMAYPAEDVRYAGFSPDGKRILSLGRTGQGTVWDAASGRKIRELELVHADELGTPDPRMSAPRCEDFIFVKAGVGYSPDGQTITLLDQDGRATLFEAATLKRKRWQLPRDERFCSLAWSHDGSRIAGASTDGVVQVWDAFGRRESKFPRRPDAVLSVAFHPRDRDVLLTAGSDRMARVWALGPEPEPVQINALRGHTETVGSAVFSRDGRAILTAADDGTARLWRLPSTDVVRPYAQGAGGAGGARDGGITQAALAPDPSAQPLLAMLARTKATHLVAQPGSPASGRAAAAAGAANDAAAGPAPASPLPASMQLLLRAGSGYAAAWDAGTARFRPLAAAVPLSQAESGRLTHLVSPNGEYLAAFDAGRLVALHTLAGTAGRTSTAPSPLPFKYDTEYCEPVALSDDGATLAVSCSENERAHHISVTRLTAPSGPPVRLPFPHPVSATAFDPAGKRLVVALENRSLRAFDLHTANGGEPVSAFAGRADDVNDLQFNRAGTMLASSSYDGTVRVWDATSGRQLALVRPPRTPHAVSFDATGKNILIRMTRSVVVWECPVCGAPEQLISDGEKLLAASRGIADRVEAPPPVSSEAGERQ
jgi:WD40 repeat protein/energy-coupling factor transporter ATP-binding protein EcfA2